MAPTEAGFKDLEFAAWQPPGEFDAAQAIWYTDRNVTNSFPASGVDVFDQVDESSFWFAHRNHMIEKLIQRHGLTESFLEVGSGSGVVAAYLAEQGIPVGAVEPIASGAIRAAERGVTVSFCGDLASLDLPANSVPAVGMFDVIEHIDEPRDLLAEANRILRPGGSLLVTVPAHQWLWSDFDEWNGHFRRYSKRQLHDELATAGFEVVENSYFFLPLLLPAALSRLVLSRLRPTRSKEEIEEDLAADLAPTNPIVDRALRIVHQPEIAAVGKIPLPTGTSIIAMGKNRAST